MLTVKVGSYTKENVDELLAALEEALRYHQNKNCNKSGCKYCASKLPCGDLVSAIDYLEDEQINGYRHCQRVHKS